MPQKYNGLMQGFQLWVNLPAKKKMVDPKYRGIVKEQIPVAQKDGVTIKVIAGKVNGVQGPVRDLAIDIEYFDVALSAGKIFEHKTAKNDTVFAYIIEGSVEVQGQPITHGHCIIFDEGETVKIDSISGGRFLFVTGEPLNEPVAWRGPIVMNTEEELEQAFEELDEGTFIKTKNSSNLK
ncbi:MAG TPA: pirin-like C-terminal cupin domain-containing protein, partial [Candidatus Acidoferrales bacterium]|nr:pirin-like C-terminal cupin domain-containing protein [Candidatus Acidoferrales bacterium]